MHQLKYLCEIFRSYYHYPVPIKPSRIEINGFVLSENEKCNSLSIFSSSPSSSSIPSSSPSLSPSSSPSKVASLQPSTFSSTLKWVLVNANTTVDIGPIMMDQIFSVGTIGSRNLSLRLETPYTSGRVVFRWIDKYGSIDTRTARTIPFVFQGRYLSTRSIKVFNATIFSAAGVLIGTSTIRFIMIR